MARIMSMVMALFILVPVIAPTLGQLILNLSHWRMIFILLLLTAVLVMVWFGLRQPETLSPNHRHPFSLSRLKSLFTEALSHPITRTYTVANGLIFGAFLGYLVSAQTIFQHLYHLGSAFPFYFGLMALSVGFASISNAKLVMRFGMRLLTIVALIGTVVTATVCLLVISWSANPLSLTGFILWGFLSFFCIGILMGNVTALALEPMGHLAGVASSVVGGLSSLMAVSLGTAIGQAFNGSVVPLISSFAVLNSVALITVLWCQARTAES